MTHLLFTYGTLQLPDVQRATFGREVVGEPDAVVGHVLGTVTIEDPRVVALSGAAVHPVLVPSDAPDAHVGGLVLTLDEEQLAAADAYEVDAYVRVRVSLRSGREAWVYALADPPRPTPLDLLGTWTLQREVQDRTTGDVPRVVGTSTLVLQDDGRVRWSEEGTMTWAGGVTPVSRTLFVEPRDGGWFVTFDDGRDFHPWTTDETVDHPCGADLYRGVVSVADEGTWSVRWDVSGPAKDYTMRTTFRRA